jgi:hypothetical protein
MKLLIILEHALYSELNDNKKENHKICCRDYRVKLKAWRISSKMSARNFRL